MRKVVYVDAVGQLLEELVEDYEAGRIRGIAVAVIEADGVLTTAAAGMSPAEVVGALELAKAKHIEELQGEG